MPWFKVDDGLHSHPKWLAASPHARALWVSSGSWCAAHLTDGHVPRHALPLLGGRPRDAAELVTLGLWTVDGDGWRFHDWDTFQPSAESVEAERTAARERQRRAREKARMSRRASRRDTNRDSHATDAASHGPPDPTRPDPYDNGGGDNSQAAAPAVPPPRRCNAHADLPDGAKVPACGACADARRAHVAWLKQQAVTPATAVTPLDGQQAAARARAERHLRMVAGEACQDCADTGMRLDEDGQAVPCHHGPA